jgi:hypothetical protein
VAPYGENRSRSNITGRPIASPHFPSLLDNID